MRHQLVISTDLEHNEQQASQQSTQQKPSTEDHWAHRTQHISVHSQHRTYQGQRLLHLQLQRVRGMRSETTADHLALGCMCTDKGHGGFTHNILQLALCSGYCNYMRILVLQACLSRKTILSQSQGTHSSHTLLTPYSH